MLDDLKLRVGSVTFAARSGFAQSQGLEQRIAAAVDAMRMASGMGARIVVLGAGPLPSQGSSDRSTMCDVLDGLASEGARVGVQLALQCPHAAPDDLAQLLSQLPEGLAGVDLNPAELIWHGHEPRQFVACLGPRVVHVFANDAVRGYSGAASIDVELGRGSAELPDLLGSLEEFNYHGWTTVARRHSSQPVQDCANAVAFLRAL